MCVSVTVLCLMSPLRPKAVVLSDRWTGRACGFSKISLYLSTFGNDRDSDALLTLVHILVCATLVLIPCYVYCPGVDLSLYTFPLFYG